MSFVRVRLFQKGLVHVVVELIFNVGHPSGGATEFRVDGAGVVIDSCVGVDLPDGLAHGQNEVCVVAAAEGLQGPGKLHLDQIGSDADVLKGLRHGLRHLDGLRQSGQAALVNLDAEAVLAVVAGEAGLVQQLPGEFRVVAVFIVELFLPAWVPALQRLVEDGVVHGLAQSFEQLVDDLVTVDGPVHGLADHPPGFPGGGPRLSIGIPVHPAVVILAEGQDGQPDRGQRAFKHLHAFVDRLLVQHLGHVHHIGLAGEQHCQAGQVFGRGGDFQAFELRVDAPVFVGHGLELCGFLQFPCDELVGSGASGAVLKHGVALGGVLSGTANRGAGNHQDVEPPVRHVHLRLRQPHGEGVIVNNVHVAVGNHLGHGFCAHEASDCGPASGQRVGGLLVDGQNHVLDGELTPAVVHLDTLLEVEGVLAGVGADIPCLGQLRKNGGHAGFRADRRQVFPHRAHRQMAATGGQPGQVGVLGQRGNGQVKHRVFVGHGRHGGGFGRRGGCDLSRGCRRFRCGRRGRRRLGFSGRPAAGPHRGDDQHHHRQDRDS